MKTLFIKKSSVIAVAVIVCIGVCLGALVGFSATQATKTDPKMPTVVIDAGHGGIDNGVQGIVSGCDESDINLAIAKLVKGNFINAGFNCVMTRTTEAGLYGTTEKGFKARDMLKRKQIIQECNADLVISIHQNFCPLPSKRGGTVFFDKNSQTSCELAQKIQQELNNLPQCVKPNEALYGDYYMLKCTQSPSVIVECGFLSNEEEDKLLNTTQYRKAVAYAIFKGTVEYFSSVS
ncbi:MAG: N-acetylmuramoyl-L-alanine amidase [Candidatus Coproplasma sp.]